MTLPGPSSEQKQQKQKMLLKQTLLAPIWTIISLSYTVFREEFEYNVPGAQVWAKTMKKQEKCVQTEASKTPKIESKNVFK